MNLCRLRRSRGQSREIVRHGGKLVVRQSLQRVDDADVDAVSVTDGQGANLRQEIGIVLTSERWHSVARIALRIPAVTLDAQSLIHASTDGKLFAVAELRPTHRGQLAQIGRHVANRLQTRQPFRGHDSVHVGRSAVAFGEVRQLFDQIVL